MKLSCSLLAALAVLGQTAVAAVAAVPVAARAEAAAEVAAALPLGIIVIPHICYQDSDCSPGCASRGFKGHARCPAPGNSKKLAFSHGALEDILLFV
ncbi:hypothetical protein MGYG_01650 [Nannizzia gypsea CBS 118893]|uniref:Uncharacterized protein n=1 Tax=Arthroderma gypseum (strain ATCC MYA-4604 / CBS 118893) TaxID=535722 RepID=E5R262_ARTGP|nr:hypothetical protein MGYG_01650 [Nannizzia gypsea CBS 118893]EFQ98626.1 hypothetical protein MGYG_01650 [Nannizzia gypsea CBS 118893]